MAEPSLIERLTKRAKQDRDCATNSAVVVDLLAPEMAKFEARTGHNIYAVRMAVDHKNSVKRDNAFADDLEAVASTLENQAALIGECREVLREIRADAVGNDNGYRHCNLCNSICYTGGEYHVEGCPVGKLDALLTKLKASVDGATK